MSLIKQLWIGICLILILALGGSFFISTFAARHYLEQQLQLKNIDNATSLALSITQMDKDPVSLELLVAAQFDSGHYQSIRLLDPKGEPMVERNFQGNTVQSIPQWFDQLLAIEVTPGTAQIQDGWQQFATIEVQSHSRYAKEELWNSSKQLLQWLLLAAIVFGGIGTLILKMITRPLGHVVNQAESIGQRRFVMSQEPRTREFRRLVRAMNKLSSSVKNMLDKETEKLEKLRQESQQDELTKLPNREHFLNLLDSTLTREDSEQNAAIYLFRIMDLISLNQQLGRERVDALIVNIAQTLQQKTQESSQYAGRLNGTDFAFVSFQQGALANASRVFAQELYACVTPFETQEMPIGLAIGATDIHQESRGQLLSRLDGLLAGAEQKGNRAVVLHNVNRPAGPQRNLNDWRLSLTQALATPGVELGRFAVRSVSGTIIHWERPVRLTLDGQSQTAGYFVAWARRLDLLKEIDWQVARKAIQEITDHKEATAINVSETALLDPTFRANLFELAKQNSLASPMLYIEFPESCAVRQMPLLKELSRDLREFGCKIGLEHVGLEFTHIKELEGIGLDYLKIDNAIIREVDLNTTNHAFIKSLCNIGHSLGMVMIAEGVMNDSETQALAALDIDGVTGPGVQ
ncbi:EAL domain-containing protein [Gilvimarinus agarilyticus]|uniref:bifunctional diguanylate cyclase/phosphodiesterase n=1 Tax=unclassified Gilvimarinus TaxID=2642066 RepID=UPI001C080629|nr:MULTISPECIES: LapD/MoxY N-terminal periplasmic domain-containing protein [unclassified Gilvimarinus]MBU2886278.1 EAL domain-containing protein [Gilvimarinus agarilyticus]MDO6570964.1 LapD/MoxY N-terminal periplasmic domain-containing protein [Gilvimarinus sp. 2_MG-2023]MDO6747749.1 LapD/MoxY N-terminal periplasmic domain-containing protein [Gilvimarinus sp. 1_MG-2023]